MLYGIHNNNFFHQSEKIAHIAIAILFPLIFKYFHIQKNFEFTPPPLLKHHQNIRKYIFLVVREETPLLEDEGVDKVTAALVKPLLEMTEETPGAVQMLIDTHQKMREKFEKYTKRFSKKVLEFL